MIKKFKADEIMQVLDSLLPTHYRPLALHEPSFAGNEWNYIKQCLDSGWVSSAGQYVNDFEEGLKAFTGTKYAVAVVNGTAALHLSLLVSGFKAGDEVLLPTLTFIATPNAVKYIGAIPHFVDSCEYSLGLDGAKLDQYLREVAWQKPEGCFNKNTGRRIKA